MVEVVIPEDADVEKATNAISDIMTFVNTSSLTTKELIDEVEVRIMKFNGAEFQGRCEQISFFPLKHRFTPGMYIREIFMPAGAVLTSQIHKTEHPFVISKGRCLVYLNNEHEWKELVAPHTGITYPGTRRILVILEDTIWTTFHPTELTDLLEIERHLSEDYTNPLLSSSHYHKILEIPATLEDKIE
jgi:hypothetical protein